MSEPSSLDSLPEQQLPNWKTVVWNIANEIDLEKSSSWYDGRLRNHFIAMARLLCRVIAWRKLDVDL